MEFQNEKTIKVFFQDNIEDQPFNSLNKNIENNKLILEEIEFVKMNKGKERNINYYNLINFFLFFSFL